MGVPTLKRPPQARPEREPPVAPGAYITDEVRLFRCLPSEGDGAVLLEDCLSLEHILCSFEELATGMRLVKPGEPTDG